ncbi:hypothetical protein TVAG_022860 [Trichomonas vaginalis G3]|uniref:Uncharacterized protein n=1 Tax=Trichomonas vaginalis (strain ATCC PRA-98 / G3) TaxID=412133 RepID=A2GLP2_TRIV3|nr:hypothetical protein TVAGG3_0141050 [Trichomonas vaginalis G3]EAX81925.1 hypothetical protein TVAG_022860 [Trichomonas vaginalis G3]KAI5546590.1 hypothetical protein TVAGG3_0141050 [Trichomonas vaginalis G3]|eukprot:XP_001294855.1 hypothetical protein [Trichomonas vaginalis G3]
MRRGRPTQHTRAKWITYTSEGTEKYYELDDKGRLVKTDNLLAPHHTAAFKFEFKPPPIPVLVKPSQVFTPNVILPLFNMLTLNSIQEKMKEQPKVYIQTINEKPPPKFLDINQLLV